MENYVKTCSSKNWYFFGQVGRYMQPTSSSGQATGGDSSPPPAYDAAEVGMMTQGIGPPIEKKSVPLPWDSTVIVLLNFVRPNKNCKLQICHSRRNYYQFYFAQIAQS